MKDNRKKNEFLIDYYQINTSFFFVIEEFDLTLKNLKAGIQISSQIENPIKKIKLLTKAFFYFADERSLSMKEFVNDLKYYYRRFQAYPDYWKICLAYHFKFRFIKLSKEPLLICLSKLSSRHAQKAKQDIIRECQLKMYQSYYDSMKFQLSMTSNNEHSDEQNPERDNLQLFNESNMEELYEINSTYFFEHIRINLPKMQLNKRYNHFKFQLKKKASLRTTASLTDQDGFI